MVTNEPSAELMIVSRMMPVHETLPGLVRRVEISVRAPSTGLKIGVEEGVFCDDDSTIYTSHNSRVDVHILQFLETFFSLAFIGCTVLHPRHNLARLSEEYTHRRASFACSGRLHAHRQTQLLPIIQYLSSRSKWLPRTDSVLPAT